MSDCLPAESCVVVFGTIGAFCFSTRLMHFAKKIKCRVQEVIPAVPGVLRIKFTASKRFHFEPGQFLSMVIPKSDRCPETIKRCYSFSCSPEEARESAYEICVKLVPGGIGSLFLARLRPGDTFAAFAPYGDFRYRQVEPGRSVCFIATGTGVAPFRSMIYSDKFLEHPPKRALIVMGARTEKELLFRGSFEHVGVETVHAVSNVSEKWAGFRGRVTDYLRTLPKDWSWHSTDFYLCGNGEMVSQVKALLSEGHGVSSRAIHQECFTAAARGNRERLRSGPAAAPSSPGERFLISLPLLKSS